MTKLEPGQFAALRNLGRKREGEDVDWINIADARALTEFGLAERNREGWTITQAGIDFLKSHEAEDRALAPVSEAEAVSNIDGSARPT